MTNDTDFTLGMEDVFYDTVDMEAFHDDDSEVIYDKLLSSIRLIPFCTYLKRYIYRRTDFDLPFDEVEDDEYRYIIMDSFKENAAPKSFSETTTKFSAIVKNWLKQTSVNRQVVFLLGFGLGMTVDEVSEFLTHVLSERDFNFKNPFEIICWYCYSNGYKYPKFEALMEEYKNLPVSDRFYDIDMTIGMRNRFRSIKDEAELMSELAKIKQENSGKTYSVSAKLNFNALYDEARKIIARIYSDDAESEAQEEAEEYLEKLENSFVLSLEEKTARAEKIRRSAKKFTPDDITESDVAKFVCCGIPFDGKGNLSKENNSTLHNHFHNKRLGKQHINEILSGKCEINRFDLITMNFFVFAMDETITDNKTRFIRFVDDTNEILRECYMGDMYVANPYECFLMMCILSDYPMGAYADVLEMSYEQEENQ